MKKLWTAKKIKSLLIILLIVSLSGIPAFAVTPTLLQCDINGDGTINVSDLNEMSNHMGATGIPGWIKEDVDKNGIVQVCDMMFVANHYGESVTTNAGTTNAGTTNAGTTNAGTSNGIARIQKMSICYSGNIGVSACRTYIAQHFDLVDTSIDSDFTDDVQWVKNNAVNRNIKVIGYYDVVFSSSGLTDSWYVHNGGSIVTASSGAGRVMNPSSGWANYFIQRAKTALNSNTMYDGIFCDDDWYDPTYDNEYWSSSPSKWDISMANWKSSMVTFMGNLKTTLGSDIVMANVEPPSALTIGDETKAVILENFVHQLETSATSNGRTSTVILDTIDYLHTQAAKGNIIAALSGCNAGTGYEDWAKFCYACFAFAVVDPSKAYFAYNFMQSSPTRNPTWFQWMDDYVIGSPTDNYHSISGNVYERTFTKYYVIANLNNLGSSVTFTFNGASHTLEGKHALFISR